MFKLKNNNKQTNRYKAKQKTNKQTKTLPVIFSRLLPSLICFTQQPIFVFAENAIKARLELFID